MKTAIIYNNFGEDELRFFVIDGDHSHLNNACIGSGEDSDLEDQALDLLYEDGGARRYNPDTPDQFVQAIRDGAKMITIYEC